MLASETQAWEVEKGPKYGLKKKKPSRRFLDTKKIKERQREIPTANEAKYALNTAKNAKYSLPRTPS